MVMVETVRFFFRGTSFLDALDDETIGNAWSFMVSFGLVESIPPGLLQIVHPVGLGTAC